MSSLAIATFDTEAAFRHARRKAVSGRHVIVGEWMPYAIDPPIAAEGEAGILRSVLVGGATGGLLLFIVETWSAVLAYPIDTGARALWSWQTFIPAPVELSALTGALAGTIRMFVNASLTRLHHPAFELDEVARASRDSFVLALACDDDQSRNIAFRLLAEAGAKSSRLVRP